MRWANGVSKLMGYVVSLATTTHTHLSYISQMLTYAIFTRTCLRQESGLTQACIVSPHSYEQVEGYVYEYIKRWVPDVRVGVLGQPPLSLTLHH
jgi:oligoribonuclease (3'-5' exoribonuclease)